MLRNLPLESIRKKDLVMKSYPEKNGKKALITGITGQDGAYLAELLLKKGSVKGRGAIHQDGHWPRSKPAATGSGGSRQGGGGTSRQDGPWFLLRSAPAAAERGQESEQESSGS